MRVMVIGVQAPDECYQSDNSAGIEMVEIDPNAKWPPPSIVQYIAFSHTNIILTQSSTAKMAGGIVKEIC